MKKLPRTRSSLLLRVDFTDDAAWDALSRVVVQPSEKGFRASLDCVSDRDYDGLTVEQLVALAPKGSDRSFAFIADRTALGDPERPVLVVDLYIEPGRTFRVIPQQMWSVENNLSIANMMRVLQRRLREFHVGTLNRRGSERLAAITSGGTTWPRTRSVQLRKWRDLCPS